MIRLSDGRFAAELLDCAESIEAAKHPVQHVQGCGCGDCVWVDFVQTDPFGAGDQLAMAEDLEKDNSYRPPLFVRGLLSTYPWMDWLLLCPPSQRRWLLEGVTFSELTYPIFSAVLPAWAWNALRAEGLDADD